MLGINTNLSSLIAQNSLNQSTNKLNTAIERMSTGCKINHAKDNAANYSISTNMTTKIGAYQVAEDNALQGLDMINTASESLTLIEDKLMRLRALAEQSANGTYGAQSKQAINQEANAIVDEIERLYNTTEYNGINLAKGKVIGTEESKFIKDIDRRDTSKMTTLASVAIDEALTSGTYSISTADELAKLATMTNNGLIGAGCEFVLGADIDLNGYSNWTPIGTESTPFGASFDGNGYIVSNLSINKEGDYLGLFGEILNAQILNIGVVDASIKTPAAGSSLAPLVGSSTGSTFYNCYSTGVVSGCNNLGGLIGYVRGGVIQYCYSDTDVSDNGYVPSNPRASGLYVGGFVGMINDGARVMSCFSQGEVSSSRQDGPCGGFVGRLFLNTSIIDSYALGSVSGIGSFYGDFVGMIDDTCFYKEKDVHDISTNAKIYKCDKEITLQIGSDSKENSQINFNCGWSKNGLSTLRNIGIYSGDYLTQLDKMLSQVSEKQTEFGSVQNRLESVVEEIGIQYDNLVSSRSTLRDADIAEVSAEYIQQQILQQASATLLATANQSPSIALQLL